MTIRVLYIGGSGRSGSTLIDRVIGQLPGFASTGEVRDIARAGLGENRLCGCGAAFDACPFWTEVGDRAFGGWDAVDRDALERAASVSYTDAARNLLRPDDHDRTGADAELLVRLYAGIAQAAEGATIVDSSKAPPYGVLLSSLADVDLRAVHLVRDSRGVAYSWSKTVIRPDTPGRTVEMLRLGPAQVSARWIAHNAMMEALGRRISVARLSYEAFLASPRSQLTRVLREVSSPMPQSALDFIDESSVRLQPNHTVMGNPMRMSTGTIQLRVDDAWQRSMPAANRAMVTAMTWPMLVRYGYRLP